MPNVVRFTLSTARDLDIPGAGQFIDGVLDVDANDLKLVSRTRYLVYPYHAVEVGIVDSATPKPSLPAVPVPPPADPYPQYMDPSEIFDSESGRIREDKVPSRLSDAELRAASVAAVEDATTVSPAGAWDFAQPPTVAGAAIGTGGGDLAPAPTGNDRAALQALIDALPAGGGCVRLRGGTYTLSGSPLVLPSRVTLAGAGRGSTIIQQTTAGIPAIVSRNWLSATGASPGGNTHLRDLTVYGATGTGAHGIVLRDFYSSIINVSVYNCGGHGILVTAYNDVDAAISGTLVENRFDRLDIHECAGWGFFNRSSGGALSDAWLGHVNVDGGGAAGGTGGVQIQGAAGWAIGHVHAYGNFTSTALRIDGAWNTYLHSAQIEEGWTGKGIVLAGLQRAMHLGDVSITCNDRAGEVAIEASKSGSLNPLDGSTIDALTVVQDHNQPTTGLTWDSTGAMLRVGAVNLCGDYAGQVTALAGSGSSAIILAGRRVMTQAAYTALAVKDPTLTYLIVG